MGTYPFYLNQKLDRIDRTFKDLYLLEVRNQDSLSKNKEWESLKYKCTGFLIRAGSETEARAIAQLNGKDETSFCKDFWLKSGYVEVSTVPTFGDSEVIIRDIEIGGVE